MRIKLPILYYWQSSESMNIPQQLITGICVQLGLTMVRNAVLRMVTPAFWY